MRFLPSFLVLSLCVSTVQLARAQSDSLAASDDSFEDRVELAWTMSIPSGQFFRVERDAVVLAIRSRTETSYADRSGDPGAAYTYCVIPSDAQGNDGTAVCDTGRRSILPPAAVAASDRTLEDRVSVTWSDRSEIEAGYRVYRTTVSATDSTLLATLAANRTVYNDPSAVVGTTYRYCIVAFDGNGFSSVATCDEGTRGAVMPPAAVVATDGQFNDRVRVTWVDQTSEETGYTVYRDGTQIGALGVDGMLFDDLTAASEVDYTYCVTATIGGIESVEVCDSGRRGGLAPPQSVVATDNTFDDRVDLSWQDVVDTEDGFLVTRYRDGVVDSAFAVLGPNAETFSDASAEQTITYSYCVQSFSDIPSPDRSLSVEVCDDGTRSAVLAPTAVSATDRTYEDKSEITWTSASTTAMLFNIYRDGVLVDNVPGNETLFGDTQIASGTEYNYCVSAMTVTGASVSLQAEVAELVRLMRPAQTADVDGEVQVSRDPQAVLLAVEQLARPSLSVSAMASQSAAGDIVESAQVCDTGSRLLKPPTQLAATFEDFEDHVEISWTDNSSVERGHRIYRQGPADPQPVLVGEANTGRVTFGDYRGTPGVTYTYSVRTFDLRGPGGESSADSDTGARKLEAPTGLRAADDNSETEVSLSWKDNSRAETGYEIKRDGSVIATTAANAISYRDSTPVPGVLHRYELTAVDSLGRSESAVLDAGTLVLPPGSFNASDAYLNRVVLAWDDRSTEETNYQVTRNGDLLAVLEAGSTGYEDFGAVPGTSYTYCVTTGVDLGFVVTNSVPACDTGIRPVEVFGDLLQRVAPLDSTLDERSLARGFSNVAISGTVAVFALPRGGPPTRIAGRDGAPDWEAPQGAVYIFEQDPASRQWIETAQFLSENYGETVIDQFGGAVAISNNTIVVAATGVFPPWEPTGLAVVILRDEISGQWARSRVLRPSMSVGTVALDGNTMVFTGREFGGPQCRIYERPSEGEPFAEVSSRCFLPNTQGFRIDVSGDYMIVGADGQSNPASGTDYPGQARIYRRDLATGVWALETELGVSCQQTPCENPRSYGQSVSISGGFAFVGDQTSGTVYVYRRDPATGRYGQGGGSIFVEAPESQRIVAPVNDDDAEEDYFGAKVTVSGGLAAISATRFGECKGEAPPGPGCASGAVFLYRLLASGEWEYFRRFDPQGDELLSSVGNLSGDGLVFSVQEYPPSPSPEETPVIPRFYASTRPIDNVLVPPQGVEATDGTFEARVQVAWSDQTENEDAYRVYRDGELIAELEANTLSFADFDLFPGQLAEYCIETVRLGVGDTPRNCDFGWRPVDGAISGSVRAPLSGASSNSSVSARQPTRTGVDSIGNESAILTSDAVVVLGASAAIRDSVLICLTPDPDRGLLFDGIGGSVEVPTFGRLPGSFTIEFWARRTEIDDGEHVLFSIGDAESTKHLSARYLPDGTFRVTLGALEGVLDMDVVQNSDLDWHHWAVTQTPGGPRQILRDGQVVLTDATPASVLINGPLVLGSFFGASGFFAGVMDEVRVWETVQTPVQIAAGKDQRLSGSEEGLIGYWPMNQGRGRAVGDETRFGRHGRFRDGVYWSTAGALQTCTLADTQGKFTLGAIRYNESTTFTVTPYQEERVFDPPASEITLNTQNPVENQVDFVDVTQLGVTGRVLFAGTECPVPDVEILADDLARGTTVSDGTFRASLSPRAEEAYRFVPRRVNPEDPADTHDFVPSSRDLIVDRALFGVDFADTKTRPLHAFFGGSCALVANLGTVTIEVTTENGCFSQEYQVSGGVDIDLPPQKYLVQVKDVQTADDNLRADMIQYFDDLGVQEIDLTNARDTLDLTYHAPISMTVSGLPAPPAQCTAYSTGDGATLPPVPLLQQGRSYDLTLNVREDYGQGRVCPVSNGTVSVFDAIADSANTRRVYDIENGEVVHTTIAASPNIFKGASVDGVNRSFQKSFTASAQVPGRDPFVLTEWVVVEGVRARTAEFVSATTDPFPVLIVHDPPGTNSSAFLEEGTTQCTTMSNMQVRGVGTGGEINIVLGFKAAVGFGLTVENGGGLALRAKTIGGVEIGGGSALEVCATTTERFATSGDIGWSGEDVFVGVALNLVFARADELAVNQCTVALDERLAADLDTDNAFETTYVYGATHIRDSLIPDLTELIELSGGDPTVSGDPDNDGSIETIRLTQALANWQAQLTNNELLKTQALGGSVVNRSFSAGADYEYSHSDDSVRTSTETLGIYVKSENGIGAVITGLGYDQTFLSHFVFNYERVTESESSNGSTTSTGYTLSDGDTGDFFSVDVGTDPRYGTPVFGTVSGRSSNPWEANTQRRDWPLLSVSPPVQYNVPPDEAARFTLNLTNASESDEPREYVVSVVKTSNPGSANISLNEAPLTGTWLVGAGETQEIALTVARGPSRYSFEDLEVIAYPQPEFEIWQADTRQQFVMSDTARFSVYYEAPCSDIAILRPKNLWSVNKANIGDSLEVILRDFDLSGSDIFDVDRIGFQYRRGGSPDWFPGRAISVNKFGAVESDSLDAVDRSWAVRWQPQRDGAYDLRAFTECSNGESVYSEAVTGIVDTKAPKTLGAPAPADEVLTFGGSIVATFDEPVACSSIVTSGDDTNTTLTYLDGPSAGATLAGFEAVCDGKTVVLDPPDEFDWTPAEGRLVQASLAGVTDIYGNPVAEPVRWQFTVRRSAFAWDPANLNVEIPRGTSMKVEAKLINGRAQPAEYRVPETLLLLPENGSTAIPLALSNTTGTVVAQGEQNIGFTVPDSLLPGRYTSTLPATRYEDATAMEEIPLYFTADVVCRAPEWNVSPFAFEQSMTITARLMVEGVASTDTADVVVALVNGEVRGVAPVTEPSPGVFLVQMLIYGDSQGDLVKFQVWDSDRCMLHRETSKAFLFRSGQILGTFGAPVDLEAPPQVVPQAVNLAAGWTWFSTNRVATDPSINSVLSGVIAAPGDLVKSQTAYAQYDATSGWVGPLTDIENGKGYFAKLQQSNRLLQSGTATDPTSPISLNKGWTWIGYLPTAPLAVNDALASLTPAAGDLIKSQYGFAQFADDIGWIGSLTSLEPGLGYLMYTNEVGTLAYPAASTSVNTRVASAAGGSTAPGDAALKKDTPSVRAEEAGLEEMKSTAIEDRERGTSGRKLEVREEDNIKEWKLAARDFPETMTIVAEVRQKGAVVEDPEFQIGLFAGDELRGLGRIRHVDEVDRHLAFIMVYGDESSAEPLDVRLLNPATGEVEVMSQHPTFEADGRLGTVADAVVLEGVSEEIPVDYALDQNYPNPFNPETAIRFGLPEAGPVNLEVFDVIGRRVAVLMNKDKVASGWHVVQFDASELASGVYFYRINAGDFKAVHKMTLLK